MDGLFGLGWLVHQQVDLQVKRVGQGAAAGQRSSQGNGLLRFSQQVDIAPAALVIHPRAEEPHPGSFTQMGPDQVANGVGLLVAKSHGGCSGFADASEYKMCCLLPFEQRVKEMMEADYTG